MPKRFHFDSQLTTYFFTGRLLDPPDPSTYDAAVWTSPTIERWAVGMQDDQRYWIRKQPSDKYSLESDEYDGRPSRRAAAELLRVYLERTERHVKEETSTTED